MMKLDGGMTVTRNGCHHDPFDEWLSRLPGVVTEGPSAPEVIEMSDLVNKQFGASVRNALGAKACPENTIIHRATWRTSSVERKDRNDRQEVFANSLSSSQADRLVAALKRIGLTPSVNMERASLRNAVVYVNRAALLEACPNIRIDDANIKYELNQAESSIQTALIWIGSPELFNGGVPELLENGMFRDYCLDALDRLLYLQRSKSPIPKKLMALYLELSKQVPMEEYVRQGWNDDGQPFEGRFEELVTELSNNRRAPRKR